MQAIPFVTNISRIAIIIIKLNLMHKRHGVQNN